LFQKGAQALVLYPARAARSRTIRRLPSLAPSGGAALEFAAVLVHAEATALRAELSIRNPIGRA